MCTMTPYFYPIFGLYMSISFILEKYQELFNSRSKMAHLPLNDSLKIHHVDNIISVILAMFYFFYIHYNLTE